ncbi:MULTISPECIES: bis(5'-nucleosyl)-tetraphosphatase (symmetrical) YqeK [unclassified Bacillus (in: firmicutes)]|uniref:bis(5'-nucleosyl)-tetraphosphatase (symmetrical) YqeK n=1 Tax=unclassified Bacillus (in: firmicutes) TaxID=185979 RepID=UPI000BF18E83|nr:MULTISPECIES: bis(5'-nucleosyl)-tetraphosphatase (symmetrical) YqeK [unclassified Bacillus (in: firmicutes)]PEJ56400.1 phosphohydrolase [Bacillus sp. AFS002410]PEL14143.1 phosphohydrolase [Bacillus sp. AFS017336]
MDKQKALSYVKEKLTNGRFTHTIGVMETAVRLAEKYGADVKKAELAAIFHDVAKCMPIKELKAIMEENELSLKLLKYNKELWHAPVGAFLTKHEYGIDDKEILRAIKYHTSGHKEMNLLDKIIYVADYIEPNRNFPGVEEARELAEQNLDRALLFALKNTITFLINKEQTVYPLTVKTYNSILKQVQSQGEQKNE